MAKQKEDAKNVMLAHSEAKVEFYKKYLERYLLILGASPDINEVNIFDVYCGTGIYNNDKKGSPIEAFETIKKLRENSYHNKPISLIINDGASDKVSKVKELLDSANKNFCTIQYFNKSADDMFKHILGEVKKQNGKVRNLIFIDPYGYKEIKKATLSALIDNGRSEIILFLPISQMQRFTQHALDSDEVQYIPLKNFVDSFFAESHPVRETQVDALTYLDYLTEALRFDHTYFSASYYIERNSSLYYGLFFITQHIYGFEKILEVKWKLDEEGGRGFRQPIKRPGLFDAIDSEDAKNRSFQRLENLLKDYLTEERDNRQLYKFALDNCFRPKHVNEIFNKWKTDKPKFKAIDCITNKPPLGYYINYNDYRNAYAKAKFIIK